jgi:hypothetical protein
MHVCDGKRHDEQSVAVAVAGHAVKWEQWRKIRPISIRSTPAPDTYLPLRQCQCMYVDLRGTVAALRLTREIFV